MQDATRKANKFIERHESLQNIRRERNDAESRATSLENLLVNYLWQSSVPRTGNNLLYVRLLLVLVQSQFHKI